MTDIDNATATELVDAIVDAMQHEDDLAVRALVVRLTQVDREAARRLVRSSAFIGWHVRYYRQRWLTGTDQPA
jgi:hypothetical protein